jgi:hypothetical protein
VTDGEGGSVTKRGVLYAPTSSGLSLTLGTSGVTEVDMGQDTGGFGQVVTGLSPQTGYSFVAFATNSIGTGYSAASTFVTTSAPSSLVVTTTSDALNPGNGLTSLRQAINYADSLSGDQTITFSSLFNTPQTITLNSSLGMLDVTKVAGLSGSITIDGPGAGLLSVSGGSATRVFYQNGGTATLSGLTVTGGAGGGGNGGGIFKKSGVLTLTDSTVSGNTGSGGGGIYEGSGTLTLTDCTVAGNTASNFGGGIEVSSGTATLTDCTVTGNSSPSGGGLFNFAGTTTLIDCTVAGNSAGNGSGLWNNRGSVTIGNSIVSGNTSSGDIDGSYSGSHNFIGVNAMGVGAMLAPLGNYGGPTQTMPPLPGSPVIGVVPANTAGTPAIDQRGLARDTTKATDIGAVETLPLVVNTTADGNIAADGTLTLRQALNLAAVDLGNETITFDPTAFNIPQTITLANGPLALSDTGGTIAISGPSAGVTISGGGLGGVFVIGGGTTASLANLTITGGGIADYGTLTLTGVTLTGNQAVGNDNQQGGGALFVGTSASAVLVNSTLVANSSIHAGGAIEDLGSVVVTDSTFTGNSAPYGGAIDTYGNVGSITAGGTIFAGDSATFGPEIYDTGPVNSLGNNLVAVTDASSGWIAGDLTGTSSAPLAARLGTLGSYGGPTRTVPLLLGSPAIGAGAAFAGISTDQRGVARPGTAPDIGAFETQTPTVTVTDVGGTYAGAAYGATGASVVGPNGTALSSFGHPDLSYTYYAGTLNAGQLATATPLGGAPSNAGNYTVVAAFTSDVVGYRNAVSPPVNFAIIQAEAMVVVTRYTVTYDGQAHAATGTATGVNGINLVADLNLDATHHFGAGSYLDAWTFHDPAGNYKDAGGTVSDAIAKVHLTVSTIVGTTDIGHGGAVPTPTVSYSGFVNGENASVITGVPTFNGLPTTSSSAGVYPITALITGLSASNYDFPTVVPATINVHPVITDIQVEWGLQSMSILNLNRDLPFSDITGFKVLFSDPVNIASSGFSLTSTANGPAYAPALVGNGQSVTSATWTVGTIGIDRLLLALQTSNITASAASTLALMGTTSLAFSVLPGDFNGDGVVSSADMVGVNAEIPLTYDVWADITGTGTVTSSDVTIVRSKIGTKLPPH